MTSRAQAMSIGRFRSLAEIWGGDIARWPEAERAAAAQLAARAPEAAAALAEAAALDAALAALADAPGPAPSAALLAACAQGAVDAAAARAASRASARRPARWPVAAMMAAGADIVSAMRFANRAAGVVVGKLGTAVAHLSDLETED